MSYNKDNFQELNNILNIWLNNLPELIFDLKYINNQLMAVFN